MGDVAAVDLSGKRALVLGAETAMGKALAMALAEAGATVAVVAATTDAEAAFAVQRLARRIGGLGRRSLAQAIDARNEAAVRVMTRQVSKELGGLDALLVCADLGEKTADMLSYASRFAVREMARGGGGAIAIVAEAVEGVEGLAAAYSAQGVRVYGVAAAGKMEEELVGDGIGLGGGLAQGLGEEPGDPHL